MLSTFVYRQNAKEILCLDMLDSKNIDKIIGNNLKRLRAKSGFTQDKLGEMIGVDGVVIAQIEGSIRGMGKSIMSRICKALDIQPYEFYIDEKTPLPASELEKKALYMAREAEHSHLDYIAEEIIEYGKQRIERVKKQKKVVSYKGKTVRAKAAGRGA